MLTRLMEPVTTKILPPRCPPGLIGRPRLLDLIEQVQEKQVALIKAGPGFGKSSLAVAWAERLAAGGSSIAWLAIDDDDDEPSRFLFHVSHALRRANPRVGDTAINLVSEISLTPFNTVVSTWINDLADVDNDIFLFLDDYHRITDHEIHGIIAYLLRYAPSHFHVVLVVTGDTDLPLARLRSHNQLLEIDGAALRFDLAETMRFLDQEKIDKLDVSEIRMLHTKTEGWPAVLRIMATTLCQPGQDASRYIRGLSGALRPIGAYLGEMLKGVSHDTLQFMLRIAILERFSAPLCEAITGTGRSQQILEAIETSQILLVALDPGRHWYRYHSLLHDYLRERLQREIGREIPRLHRRAYRWYASRHLWTEAIRHAVAAGDAEETRSWIEQCAMELVKRGDLLTLLGWQRLFPTEIMQTQISVGLAIAWGLALAMRFDEALDLVVKLERQLDKGDPGDGDAAFYECMAIRAVVIALQDDSQRALPLAETCLGKSNDPWSTNAASNVALFGHWKAGDLQRAYAVRWLPYSSEEHRRNLLASVYRRCLHGLIQFHQLRLLVAEAGFVDALELAERHAGPNTVAAALPASLLARIRYEQDRIDDAEALVIDRRSMIDATCMLECVLSAYTVLVGAAAQRRNFERADALLEQLESLGHRRQWRRIVAATLAIRTRLFLAEDRIMEASVCVDRLTQLAAEHIVPLRGACSEIRDYALLARAELSSAQSRFFDAIAVLRPLREQAEAIGNRYFALRVALQLSQALFNNGEVTEASNVFLQILDMAESGGIFRTILDDGPDIGNLLLKFRINMPPSGDLHRLLPYVDKLVAGWRNLYEPNLVGSPPSTVVQSLSPRERSILERIGHGQSNKEISRELGIAPETVKSHVKNIFIKLSVERRAQAVSRAQSLGLIRT